METHMMGATTFQAAKASSIFSRVIGMAYALMTYAIGAGALFWLFFAAGGFAPYGLADIAGGNALLALAVNLALVFLFALQHTVMARKGFKNWLTQFIPSHLERATFVLFSGIAVAALVWFWQALPGVVWELNNTIARTVIYAGFFAGIVYVLVTSLITNHFELFGLRQAYLHLIGRPYTPLEFKRIWFYRFSRHPMMLGILLVLWCTPDMTATRLCLSILLTVYLFAGIKFEERGLIQEFGDKYREYKQEIGLFFTIK